MSSMALGCNSTSRCQHELESYEAECRSMERQTNREARVMRNVGRHSSWMGHEAYHSQWRRCRSRIPLRRSKPTRC